ncbi:MAG: hypothetical protein AAFR24_06715 [Cyanobacteria bacterium J06627_3]
MKLTPERLKFIASTVPKAKFSLGDIVSTPKFPGVIIAINAYNDDDPPYISYTVQNQEYEDFVDDDYDWKGFEYQGECIETFFEGDISLLKED